MYWSVTAETQWFVFNMCISDAVIQVRSVFPSICKWRLISEDMEQTQNFAQHLRGMCTAVFTVVGRHVSQHEAGGVQWCYTSSVFWSHLNTQLCFFLMIQLLSYKYWDDKYPYLTYLGNLKDFVKLSAFADFSIFELLQNCRCWTMI